MSETQNESRADDARLHTALYGAPCEWRAFESAAVFVGAAGFREVVPFYSSDVAAAHQAEGALPEKLRGDYMDALERVVLHVTEYDSMEGAWNLRRATPAQMVQAMLSALPASNAKPKNFAAILASRRALTERVKLNSLSM